MSYQRQIDIPVIYDGLIFDEGLRLDVLVAKQNVKDIELPFCLKEEQHQIVQEIESRLSVCDRLEEDIKKSLEKAEALRQSILKKAFDGKLLSEAEIAACKKEPDWEPAKVLLSRIERSRNAKKGKTTSISSKI